jgi:subtilisin family serine protease
MKSTLQKLSFYAILSLIPTLSISQTIHKDFVDGEVYFKLYDHVFIEEAATHNGVVDIDKFSYFTQEQILEYGIYKIEQPFYRTSSITLQNTFQVHFAEVSKVYEMIEAFHKQREIDYVEQVPILRHEYTPNDLGTASGNNSQWYLHKINAQAAWDISKGNPNVVVAIVDDAVMVNHIDLNPNAYINTGEIPNNGIDDDGNGYVDDYMGFDISTNSSNPNPPNANFSHGTHVAGIVGAATDNGIGIASIGFGIKILGVKASTSNTNITHGYPGVTFAADAGAHVINMSWGGSGYSATGNNVINYAYNKGCILIAASGNDNSSSVFYPAGYNNVISVSNSTSTDAKASSSNYGTWIDITAPGSTIRSTIPSSSNPNGTYGNKTGTSMASPLVAGLCGLMLSVNPGLTQAQIKHCLLSSADNIDAQNPTFIGQLGAGRINAYKALQCVETVSSQPPAPVVAVNKETICPDETVNFSASSTAGLIDTYQWQFPGGTPATSTDPSPQVTYSQYGVYDVILTVTNSFGSNTITQFNQVDVNPAARQVVWQETFEANTINDLGWTLENPDQSISWNIYGVGGSNNGNRAAGIALFNYPTKGEKDALISPPIDLRATTAVELTFEHAHRRRQSTLRDSLNVYLIAGLPTTSINNKVVSAAESGQGNFATGGLLSTQFTPQNATDWCFAGSIGSSCFSIDMTNYSGLDNIYIKFESVNDYGNNMYIDNVTLTGTCLREMASVNNIESFNNNVFTVYPNPTNGIVNIHGKMAVKEVIMTDISGRAISSFLNFNRDENASFELNNVAPGYYLLQIKSAQHTEVKKLIVQ